ncbi:LacI family DNA-binding transcriptional regulator [Streptomyces sp. 110]|uniref:LacI family DNA-binding transcriptional regulator n=1 Tax=Streptomyces endocoffeicus TaxID=2898945 RepID=A0ABS1Q3H9_9ACTN|nr:LacI family DNA-binding transcriptional regulator [Streptomyces endocoffeicus]MBL1119224.1 LacI family DNA-binding transcriptional regulator [Streptomyces endocoffeicus]
MSRVILADVAKAAEVSTATVSHALNGTGRMTPSTRARVRALASALGYGGSPAPRILGLAVTTYGRTDWNFAEVPYFSQAIVAATAAAHSHGYALITLPSVAHEDLWSALHVAGVVLVDSPADDPIADVLRARSIPLAFDGRPVDPKPGEAWVDNDHTAATRRVLDHLAAQGARRIVLLAGPGGEHYTRACVAAYTNWCSHHGHLPRVIGNTHPWDPDAPFDSVLASPDRPDAVFGIYDYCGRHVLASAARIGLSIPEDLLVVCASEDPSYALCDPPVSTLSLAPDKSMPAAVTALVDLIETPGHVPVPTIVPTRLTLRASSTRARRPRHPPLSPSR